MFETAEISAECKMADEALDEAERASTSGKATAAPPNPKQPKGKGVQFIYPSLIPIPVYIGIAKEFVPDKLTVDEPIACADGQNVTKTYYQG